MTGASDSEQAEAAHLKKRLERERRARMEAEMISERVTRALYQERTELELLQAITTAANQATALEAALQTTLDVVCAHTSWPVGHAYLLAGDETGDLVPTTLWHFDEPSRFEAFRRITEAMRMPSGVGLPGRVLAGKKPAWVVDVTLDENFPRAKQAVEIGVRAGFAFPVLIGTEVAAVLEFFSDRPIEPDESLLGIMVHVGTQIGRVMERQRAEQKLQQQFQRLGLLNQINQAIAEWQDLTSLIHVVLRQLEDHLAIDLGSVYLFDSLDDTLTVATLRQRNHEPTAEATMAKGTVIPVQQSGLRVAVEGQTAYIAETARATALVPQSLAQAGMGSAVATPLIAANKLFGVLLVARHKVNAFSGGECEFLRMLSTHVAVAAHQARLHVNLRIAYDELRQTQQAVMQQERLRALGQMASGIAHDINNALSPVVGYAELLLLKEMDPATQKHLNRIKTAGEDIAHIVARLREFYRHREQSDNLSPLKLNDLALEVIELTRPRWRDIQQVRGVVIQIETDLSPVLPDVIGNASEVREALTNLIFNAADAMPEGGTLTVRTRLHIAEGAGQPSRHQIILEVCDTGVGMGEEARRRCLEPFFTTKGKRGTGLGLAMVYGVMKRHDGDIEIESKLGEGTIMRLIFPFRESFLASVIASEATATVPPLRILYIDDEPLLRELMKNVLEPDGHHVQITADGESGVEMFHRARIEGDPFDVVITDLGMPYMDGRQVALALKTESPFTPVIMLTGWGAMLQGADESPLHVDCILSKPPRLSEIREAILRLHGQKSREQKQP